MEISHIASSLHSKSHTYASRRTLLKQQEKLAPLSHLQVLVHNNNAISAMATSVQLGNRGEWHGTTAWRALLTKLLFLETEKNGGNAISLETLISRFLACNLQEIGALELCRRQYGLSEFWIQTVRTATLDDLGTGRDRCLQRIYDRQFAPGLVQNGGYFAHTNQLDATAKPAGYMLGIAATPLHIMLEYTNSLPERQLKRRGA